MKTNMKTRLLSLVLVLSMVMSLGAGAFATEQITVLVSIETRSVNGQDLLIQTNATANAGASAEQILLDLCKKNGIAVDNSQGYVAEIGGFKNDPTLYHAWSGWMYWVNGSMATVGAAQYVPKAGDSIRWCFSASGDMYGNDIVFADRVLALKEQVEIVDAFQQSDYDKYTSAEQDNLLALYADATAKVDEILNYPSKNGKAGGMAGFILANSISAWDGVSRDVKTLENKLRFAILKKQYIPADAVAMSDSRITLVQGETYQLNAEIAPAGATDQVLYWDAINLQGETSGDVLVSQDGKITAKQVTSFATVRARHGEVLAPATCVVKVVAPPEDSNLTGLSISGAKLLPTFVKTQTKYRAEVAESLDTVQITATAPGAEIRINGQLGGDRSVALVPGENIITVTSQVKDKPAQTYTIRIIRGDKLKQIGEVSNNIANSYKNTVDAWRILDSVFYLGRENAQINKSLYFEQTQAKLRDPKLSLSTLSATILALTAMGENVTAFPVGDETWNLIDLLCEHKGFQNAENVLDVFSTCFALQAITPYTPASGSTWNAKKMQDAILAQQLADGSWGFDGKTGDIDMTAMLIAALAPFKLQTTIKNAINRAVAYLAAQQQDNGGYSSFGSNNANSAEMVLIALCSAGIDAANDGRFVKNGFNLLDALFGFVTKNKDGFGFTDQTYNTFATEQGLRAFATYARFVKDGKPSKGVSPYVFTGFTGVVKDHAKADANLAELSLDSAQLQPAFDPAVVHYLAKVNAESVVISGKPQASAAGVTAAGKPMNQAIALKTGENILPIVVTAANGDVKTYTLSITRPSTETGGGDQTKPTVTFSVIGHSGDSLIAAQTVAYQSGDTPFSVLKRVAAQQGVEVKTSGSGSSIYVSSIGGLAELDYGAKSGWMYSVNGKYYQESAGSYHLKSGDTLTWTYTTDLGNDIGGGSGTGSGSATTKPTEDQTTPSVEKTPAIQAITEALLKKQELDAWELFGLCAAGDTPTQAQYQKLLDELSQNHGVYRKVTDCAAMVLAVNALGMDAQNVRGENLLLRLLNHERMLAQGVNGPIFALIAYDSLSYPEQMNVTWSRDKLIESILVRQEKDGGISLSDGDKASVDITAMAVCALSGYVQRDKVKQAMERMLTYLSGEQKTSGGFALYGEENCESAAQVLIALSSLGITAAKDTRFIKNGKTVLDALQEYQTSDGTYSHKQGAESNNIATEQALLALIANEKQSSVYHLPKRAFFDQKEISNWAQDAVTRANEEGILLGANGRFEPKRAMSRAELAAILTRALKLPNTQNASAFSDVASGDWFASAVSTIVDSKIMLGDNGKFRPNDKITREELAVVIARILNIQGGAEKFVDGAEISAWAQDAVSAVNNAEIMQGSSGKFHPKDAVTREMAACVCMRMLDYKK